VPQLSLSIAWFLAGCTGVPDPPGFDSSAVETGTQDSPTIEDSQAPCVEGELDVDLSLSSQPMVATLALAITGGEAFSAQVHYQDANGQALTLTAGAEGLVLRLLPPSSTVQVTVDATAASGRVHCTVNQTVDTGALTLDGAVDLEVLTSDSSALEALGSAYFLQSLKPTSETVVLRDLSGRVIWGIEPDLTQGEGSLVRSALVSRDGERILVLLESQRPAEPGVLLIYDWTGELVDTLALSRGAHHQLALGPDAALRVLSDRAGWHGVESITVSDETYDLFGDLVVGFSESDGDGDALWAAEDHLPEAFDLSPQPGAGYVNPSYVNGLSCTPRCGVSLAGQYPGFAFEDADGVWHTFYSADGNSSEFGASPHDVVVVGDRLVVVYDRRMDGCSGFELWDVQDAASPDSLGRFAITADDTCGRSITNGGNALLDNGDESQAEGFVQALFHTESPFLVELVEVSCDSDFASCSADLFLRLGAPDETADLDAGFGELYSAGWLTGG